MTFAGEAQELIDSVGEMIDTKNVIINNVNAVVSLLRGRLFIIPSSMSLKS